MPGMSGREYADHRGVSHTAVQKAIAAGRITVAADGTIDPVIADQEWTTATDLSKPRNSVTGVPGLEDGAESSLEEGGVPRLVSSYAASRAAREAYLARLAKLEFEQRSGKLVDADQVRAQTFALGQRMRDAFLGLPDRLAPVLTGQIDQARVHQILTEEIMTSLPELSVAPELGARAKHEKFDADMAELDFRKRAGELLEADEVEEAATAVGRAVRDALLGIPDRLAPVMVAMTDLAECRKALAEEMKRACDEMERMEIKP